MRIILAFTILIFLANCTHLSPRPEKILTAPIGFESRAEKNNIPVQAVHHLRFQRGEDAYNFLIHSEIRNGTLAIAALGPLGESIFECRIQGQKPPCKAFSENIPAEYIFEHLQIMLAENTQVSENLSPPYKLSQNGNTRTILNNQNPYITVEYSETDIWSAQMTLKNIARKFTLVLRPLNNKRPQEQ